MTSPEMLKILATNTQPRLGCILVSIDALYSTSNVVSFTADCKKIVLVYHLVPNIQDGDRKPEVIITSLVSVITTSF